MLSFFLQQVANVKNIDPSRKVVVLVGGSGYVGKALLQRFSNDRNFLFVVIAKHAAITGDNVLSIPVDITKNVDKTVLRLLTVVGRIDVLIHLAAVYSFETPDSLSRDAMLKEFDVNTIAPLLFTQAVNKQYWMINEKRENEDKKRKVIVVGSQAGEGRTSRDNLINYSATKAALRVAWDYYAPFLNNNGIDSIFLKPGSLSSQNDLTSFITEIEKYIRV